MNTKTINSEQGHWLLAKMGKKVLRPGGKELTLKLIKELNIERGDSVVEFAPGIGHTASLLIKKEPKQYTGIELNEEAAGKLSQKLNGENKRIVNRSASNTGLSEASVHKVIGEAMLTMQADHRKAEIIREAHRILKPGGLYGIHELGLNPDNINPKTKAEIQQSLAKALKVNARPLTKSEWCELLEKEGFVVKVVEESPMDLLKTKRMIDDEGIFGFCKICFNLLTHPEEKRKITEMSNCFAKYEKELTAFAIVAEKK